MFSTTILFIADDVERDFVVFSSLGGVRAFGPRAERERA